MYIFAVAVVLDWWKAVILGVVQGLTELLPISSSAHLVLVPWFFGWQDPGLTFDVALHIGTLVAVLVYFWSDVLHMITSFVRGVAAGKPLADQDARLGVLIIIASIPGAICGVIFDQKIEDRFHSENASTSALVIIALALIIMGLLLNVAERIAAHQRTMKDINFRDAVIIGAAQSVALIPGISRSGSTITTGLFLGMRRETAARFSFLLSLPITGGAALKKVYDLIKDGGLAADERLPFILGIITSGIVGYACIFFLLRYLQHNTTVIFTVYRVLLGLLILLLVVVR
jgi:undecaprenyl-diphosphatase